MASNAQSSTLSALATNSSKPEQPTFQDRSTQTEDIGAVEKKAREPPKPEILTQASAEEILLTEEEVFLIEKLRKEFEQHVGEDFYAEIFDRSGLIETLWF